MRLATQSGQGRDGFALITALWLLVALSSIGLEFSLESRERRLAATNLVEHEQARSAAVAGVETARARLERFLRDSAYGVGQTQGGNEVYDPWADADVIVADSMSLGSQRHEHAYALSIRDGGSVLDVNRLGEDDWRNFFGGLQIDFGIADQLAQAIMDWRDPDDDPHGNGGEREEYMKEGRLVLPRNQDFQSVDDLRDVLGMTGPVFEAIAPYLTVAKVTRVHVHTAPVPVLRTLPGFTDDVVLVVIGLRSQGIRFRNVGDLTSQLAGPSRQAVQSQSGALNRRIAFTTRELEISSIGRAPGHRTWVEMRAVVTKNRETAAMSWRRMQ